VAGQALEDDDFGWIIEGCYSLQGLAGGTAEHVRVLMNA
jgi:hypothetical protein